MYKISLKIPKG